MATNASEADDWQALPSTPSEVDDWQAIAAEPQTFQEMHPSFSDGDRFVVKNFTNNNEAAVNYLQRKHRNLEIAVDDATGQIKARARDGSDGGNYRVLDPELGFFGTLRSPKELARDLGDVAYDVPAGALTGLATAAGGLAGAAAGAPTVVGAAPAALAGASGAGAAASGGLELLRQKLGNALGVEQDTDWRQAGAATLGGAVSPLLFGTGGQVASSLGRRVVGESLDDATKLALQQAQRGAGGYAWDLAGAPLARTVGAKTGALFSGVGDDTLRVMGDRKKEVDHLLKSEEGLLDFLDETGAGIDSAFFQKKSANAEAFQRGLEEAGVAGSTVDLAGTKEKLKAAIRKAEKQASARKGTGGSTELLDDLREAYNKYFVYDEKVAVPRQVMKPTGVLDASGAPVMAAAEEMTEQVVRRELKELPPEAAIGLSRDLSEMGNLAAMRQKVAGPTSSQGAGFNEKALEQLGKSLKKALDSDIDAAVPKSVMPLRREMGEIINLERSVGNLVQNPRQAFTNLRNADQTTNLTNKQLFRRVDRLLGTDLQDRAAMAKAVEIYGPGRQSFFSNIGSFKSRVPAAALGTGLGLLYASKQDTSPTYSGLAGGTAGMLLGGPAAMRRYIQLGLGVKNFSPLLRTGEGAQVLQDEVMNPWLGVQP
jgi:hypothetical protein